MCKFKQSLVAFAGLLLAITAVALILPRTGRGQGGVQTRPPQDVNVINTPSVSISGPVTLSGAVSVTPARPYQISGFREGGNPPVATFFILSQQHDVPAGKDFVATWVSVNVSATPGDNVRRVQLSAEPGPGGITAFLPLFKDAGPGEELIANEQVNVIFPDRFFVSALRSQPTGHFNIAYTVSGYLVDEPATPAQ